ncbi:MAG: S8 family serine peptidase [Candidatus Cloacimonetes bacterium]|nr:S8 family serine peptidase [Candidatus Cloacimonadota bacterium]
MEAAIAIFKQNRYIEEATPEYIVHTTNTIPNDTHYTKNWGHNNTGQLPHFSTGLGVGTPGFDSRAQLAWSKRQGFGDPNIIIAIIDKGVDTAHEDLRLVAGYDFGDNDDNPMEDSANAGHGTACAGIAAAKANNGIGVAGIAGGCSVMPLKVANSAGVMYLTAVDNAILHAAQNGAHVISMSFGIDITPNQSQATEAALFYAYHIARLPIFAATGNDDDDFIYYPANSQYVISVGAASPTGQRKSPTSSDGQTWWGSNYGVNTQDARNAVNLMGPTILPTTDITGAGGFEPGNYDLNFNGTSCATPYVAGVAALLLSRYPSLPRNYVQSILEESATDMTLDGGTGWDRYTGYGLVNANNMFAVAETVIPSVSITAPANNSTFEIGQTINVSASASGTEEGGNVVSVAFYLDDVLQYTATSSPYTWSWHTGMASVGIHTIKALAKDSYNIANDTWITVNLIFPADEGFETGNFSAYPWVNDSGAPWTVQSSEKYSGTYAAKSGAITLGVTSLSLTLNISQPGDISFFYKTSAHSVWGFFSFYIDDEQKLMWPGSRDWTQASYPVTAGTHTFKWTFMRSGLQGAGSNCAWLDHIVFPDIVRRDLAITSVSYPNQIIHEGQTAVLSATVKNLGTITQSGIPVTFTVNDANNTVLSATTGTLLQGQSQTLTVNYTAIAGRHSFSASLPADENLSNNSASTQGVVAAIGHLAEGFEVAPDGWSWSGEWRRTTAGWLPPYEGNTGLYAWGNNFSGARLTTPKPIIGNSDELSFYAAFGNQGSGTSTLAVDYSADGVNWTNIKPAFSPALQNTLYTVDLSPIPAGNYYLSFVASGSYSGTHYTLLVVDHVIGPELAPIVYNPILEVFPETQDFGSRVIGSISEQSFEIRNGGDGELTIVSVELQSEDDCFSLIDTNSYPVAINDASPDNPHVLVSFSPTVVGNFSATLVVNADLGEGNISTVNVPITGEGFDTAISSFPWTEDFEGTFPPTDWTRLTGLYPTDIPTTTAAGWTYSNFANVTTPPNRSASLFIYGTSAKYWLVTPPIAIPASGYELRFDLALTTYSGSNPVDPAQQLDDRFIVLISDNANMENATVLREWNNSGSEYVYNEIATLGQNINIDLSAYTGTKYIAFYGESTVIGGSNIVYVDNVTVREIPQAGFLTVSPSPVNFGEFYVGVGVQKQISLTNTGVADLEINSITLSDEVNFSLSNLPALPLTIAPGAPATVFTATFTPIFEGAINGSVIFGDGQGTEVDLNGTGVVPAVGEICETAYEITLPLVGYQENTAALNNDYTAAMFTGLTSESYHGGKDWVGVVHVPQTGVLNITVNDQTGYSSQWMGVFLVNTIPSLANPAPVLAQAYGSTAPHNITGHNVTAGDYYIIIDNWPSPEFCYFVLDVSFTAAQAPEATTVVSPIDGATLVRTTPTLSWNAALFATGYKLSLWSENPPENILTNELVDGLSYTLTQPLANDREYKWRVVPYNEISDATGCPDWSFTTVPAGIVAIGDGTATGTYLPVNTIWNYSYSQTIYLQGEINTLGQRIEKLCYYWNAAAAGTNNDSWTIYMGHTNNDTFASTNDWVPFAELTEVFGGTVDFPTQAGWMEIVLDAPFEYNNSQNLLIAILEDSPSYTFGGSFLNTVAAGRSLRAYSDTAVPNPSNPTGASYNALEGHYPNIKMYFGDVPSTPVLSVTPDTWEFPLTVINMESTKEFTIRNIGFGTLSVNSITITDDTYFTLENDPTPIGLEAGVGTTFTLKYQPTAVGDHSTEIIVSSDFGDFTVNITASCFDPTIPLPWEMDFTGVTAGTMPQDWVRTHTNWSVQNGNNAGESAPELTLIFSPSATGQVRAITPPLFGDNAGGYELSFKHYVNHYTTPYTLKVEYSLDLVTWNTLWSLAPTASVPATTVSVELPSSIIDNTFFLAWTFDGNTYNINYWHVDDISITELQAAPPALPILVSPINGATMMPIDGFNLTWEPDLVNGGVPTSYSVYLADNEDEVFDQYLFEIDDASITVFDPVIDGEIEFNYEDRWYWTVTATNAQGECDIDGIEIYRFDIQPDLTIRNFPWTDSFETYDDFALDFIPWSQYDGDGMTTWGVENFDFPNQYYVGSYIIFNPSATTPAAGDAWAAHSGNKFAAAFNANVDANDDWLITPPIEAPASLNFSFWARSLTTQYGLERFNVLVSTTDNDPASFTKLNEGDYIEAPVAWTRYEYRLNYPGETIYVAIQCVSDAAFAFFVDDVVVDLMPPEPVFTLTPTEVDFGITHRMMPTQTKTINLGNSGSGTISIDANDIWLEGDVSDFVLVTENLPVTLGGNTYSFTIQFLPQTVGQKSATIKIQDNLTREIHSVALSGECVEEPIASVILLDGVLQGTDAAKLTWASVYGDPNQAGYVHWDDSIHRGSVGAGTNSYHVAVKFGSEVTDLMEDMVIDHVMIHIYEQPQTFDYLKIWSGTDASLTPANMIYEQELTGLTVGWNHITLTNPVQVNAEAIFVGYHVNGIASTYPSSTDGLTGVNGRGNLVELGGTWTTMTNAGSNPIAGNWLIHPHFEPEISIASRSPIQHFSPVSVVAKEMSLYDMRHSPFEAREVENMDRALRGFNVYRNGQMINANIVTAYTYLDENLLPGTYNYAVQSVHFSTLGPISAPVSVTIPADAEPFALPFFEGWDSEDFAENLWTVNGDNWDIFDDEGLPEPALAFVWYPQVEDYNMALTSYNLDATGFDNVQLSFDICLYNFDETFNAMAWEIWDGTAWQIVGMMDGEDGEDIEWTTISADISEYAANRVFKLRFRAFGDDSYDIDAWYIDNIWIGEPEIPEDLDPVSDLTIGIDGDNFTLTWSAVPGADWYGIYASEDPYGTFVPVGYVTTTSLTAPMSMFDVNKGFVRVTAGTGPAPTLRNLQLPNLNK